MNAETPGAPRADHLSRNIDQSSTRRSRRAAQVGRHPLFKTPHDATPLTAARSLDTVLVPAEPFELLEPSNEVVDAPAEKLSPEPTFFAEPDAATPLTAAETDAFEAAARLFAFTGETPIQSDSVPSEPLIEAQPTQAGAPRNRGASFKRVTAASFSIAVMGIVGLLTVGLTTPADAIAASSTTDATTLLAAAAGGDVQIDEDEIQAYVTPAEVQSAAIDRAETYSTVTMAELASESGISNFSNFFVNDPNAAIQWPFAVGVPISYGFGMRSGTMHEGADFTPGAGSPIQAIADGVVRESTDSGGAYGVDITIDHVIDGQLVSSHYAHMQYGSRQVQVGDHVTVGTVIGHTGNTGRSYGAHTHFEILMNGTTPIDPIPWLREHAGG